MRLEVRSDDTRKEASACSRSTDYADAVEMQWSIEIACDLCNTSHRIEGQRKRSGGVSAGSICCWRSRWSWRPRLYAGKDSMTHHLAQSLARPLVLPVESPPDPLLVPFPLFLCEIGRTRPSDNLCIDRDGGRFVAWSSVWVHVWWVTDVVT